MRGHQEPAHAELPSIAFSQLCETEVAKLGAAVMIAQDLPKGDKKHWPS